MAKAVHIGLRGVRWLDEETGKETTTQHRAVRDLRS